MASVQQIISQVSQAGGLARPNRFQVNITPPQILNQIATNSLGYTPAVSQTAQSNGTSVQSLGALPNYFKILNVQPLDSSPERLMFMCCAAELPGKSFNATDARTYGATFQMPFVDVYAPLTFTFIVGTDMFERNFFDAWSYTIQDPETSDFNYVSEYATTVSISQLDEFDNINYTAILYQAWPITIGQMTLEYGQFNSYHKLPVTFTYRKWINQKIDQSIPIQIQSNGPISPFSSTITTKG